MLSVDRKTFRHPVLAAETGTRHDLIASDMRIYRQQFVKSRFEGLYETDVGIKIPIAWP